MIKFTDPLPRYLLDVRQMRISILYTAVSSLAFLLILTPFWENAWFQLGAGSAALCTLVFLLAATMLLVASRGLLTRCRSLKHFSLLGYLAWNFGEIVLTALLYAFFTGEARRLGLISPAVYELPRILPWALAGSAVCVGLPFWISALQTALQDQDNTVRLTNYDDVVSDRPAAPYPDNRITLFDNSGVLKFSISPDSLYFIESDDNYIKVWYMDSAGEMRQYMLRCRLKTVEDSFADSELVRCHRKYIVNIRKVSILKSEKDGYRIDFDIDSIDPIPISKTYEQAVLARFNSR